ncbi:hypothetical protein BDR22DRAFT_975454 [Usnea florida]
MKSELIKWHSIARQTETSAMHPSTRTFGIPELLEIILEYGIPRDVLLWQRVNKTWQTAIKSSPRIQEKLFFRNEPCKDKTEQTHAIWNPFTESFLVDNMSSECCRWIVPHSFDGKSSYPTASWKQMYITSPAVIGLRTIIYSSEDIEHARPIVCRSGITISQLAEFEAEVIAAHGHSDLDVDINICKMHDIAADEET